VLCTWVLITYLPQTSSPVSAFLLTAAGYVTLTGYTSVNAISRPSTSRPRCEPSASVSARAGQLEVRRHGAAGLPGVQDG
jgi:hypothetical protein